MFINLLQTYKRFYRLINAFTDFAQRSLFTMNTTQTMSTFAKCIIEKHPDKNWTPERMSLLDIFGRFISYSYKIIQEDKDDSPVERRNWRYNSLKQLQNYNKSTYDLLSDEHKNEIHSLGTNMAHIIDYETLFEKLVFIY